MRFVYAFAEKNQFNIMVKKFTVLALLYECFMYAFALLNFEEQFSIVVKNYSTELLCESLLCAFPLLNIEED